MHVSGQILNHCWATGWVPFNGGDLEQQWRVEGGCFWGVPVALDCNTAWAVCSSENSSMLATKRSYRDGTEAPLMVREFLKLDPKLSAEVASETRWIAGDYLCVTKYNMTSPSEANIQRSKKACSTKV